MALRFEGPPNLSSNQRFDHAAIAQELRDNPGEWALLTENGANTLSMQIKRGQIAAYRPSGAFESVTRDVKGTRAKIYARYIGENGEHA